VGPNGSGKSNFLESLIFVFGKRATKMRAKKIAECINSDKNIKSAKVEIFFKIIDDQPNHPDYYETVKNSLFSISWEVNWAGHSVYKINSDEWTYEDVQKLLLKHKVDLDHDWFLIL